MFSDFGHTLYQISANSVQLIFREARVSCHVCTENKSEKVSLLKLVNVFKNFSDMNPRQEWESILFHPDSIQSPALPERLRSVRLVDATSRMYICVRRYSVQHRSK